MKSSIHRIAINLLLPSAIFLTPIGVLAAEPMVLNLTVTAPRLQAQVAFVPLAADTIMSPIILQNLRTTDLVMTDRDLPQQPHSSTDLSGTLPVWQSMGMAYLVMGRTHSKRGHTVVEYEVVDVARGTVLGGTQTLIVDNDQKAQRRAAHKISDKVYELMTGTPGDFSGRIAYIEEVGVGKDKVSRLKLMDADGENARTIHEVKGALFSPAWSPDGRHIAYSVQRDRSYPTIYIQNVDNGAATALTPFSGSNLSPSFSPDGRHVLFSSSFNGNADIYRMRVRGGEPQKIINWPSSEVQPDYAPDGKSFVFVSDRAGFNQPQIYRYEFGSGRTTKLSNSHYATSPQFNHDGSQIAFLNGSSAAIMSRRGKITTRLGNTGIDEAPSFSPNGQRVVYASKRGNTGILTIKSLQSGKTFGKSGQGILRSPVWAAMPE